MTILVVGASGATGRLVVEQLLGQGKRVKIIVRSTDYLSVEAKENPNLIITKATLLDLTDEQLRLQVTDCTAILSCLGHNLTFQGIYGQPRQLVTTAVQRLCLAVESINTPPKKAPVKFILMNTTGNQNTNDGEIVPFSQRIVVNIIRCLVPPHADNEGAASYLQTQYKKDNSVIEWAAVRPDTLIDSKQTSPYNLHQSPIRNPIFDAGKTSRINVAHFMSQLAVNSSLWEDWKMKMPVIYDQED
jgi:nucleoside-diphosphate-sugar epimerase